MNLLPGVTADAVLSSCGTYRYALYREKDGPRLPGRDEITWVMLNPSTADAETDDPTLRRIQGYSFDRWGFSSITVVNLFAFRASQPKDLVAAHAAGVDVIGPDNDRWMMLASHRDLVMAAWGAHPMVVPRGQVIRAAMGEVHHLGLTAGGFPKHPLARGKHRVPDDQEPIRWA